MILSPNLLEFEKLRIFSVVPLFLSAFTFHYSLPPAASCLCHYIKTLKSRKTVHFCSLGKRRPLLFIYLFFILITSGTVRDAWQIRKYVQYRREALWIQTCCLNDGFLKLIWQLNGCLSLRLDADMLSIVQISSE